MICIDKNSDEPYYIQIYKQIQKEILEGKLQKGTILQGSRTLAQELGIGRNTVDNAYAQLAAEGYIESSKIKVKHSGAGLYFILEFPKEMPCENLIKKAAQNGVRVYDTKRYYLDEKDKPCNEIFIGFSLIEMKEIPDCMERLQKAWL